MAFYGNVEYIQDESGIAVKVKCPLLDDWIEPIECMENQSVSSAAIPARFKSKADWETICRECPFRDY